MTSQSQHYNTSNPYEKTFGYSRAVRRGPFIFVSGTTSIDPITGELMHASSAYDQTIKTYQNIVEAVETLGGKKEDIVRVRMFVKDGCDADDIGKGMKDVMGDIGPAATMIIGAKFVREEMKVEIEADAVTIG
jgi:enamine deaminase RidA (YjgF/YER057c/UK114 family)